MLSTVEEDNVVIVYVIKILGNPYKAKDTSHGSWISRMTTITFIRFKKINLRIKKKFFQKQALANHK